LFIFGILNIYKTLAGSGSEAWISKKTNERRLSTIKMKFMCRTEGHK